MKNVLLIIRHVFITLFLCVMLGFIGRSSAIETVDSTDHSPAGTIIQLEINGAIGPGTSDYIERNLDYAAETGAVCVLIRMDTPGGLDASMRQIIKKIIASPVPVVSFVGPGGARAASAGTYILYASHVAAMAPGTNLGAATPVKIGVPILPGDEKSKQADDGKSDNKAPAMSQKDPMAKKMVNDAVAYIRGLAKMRGRNADWAEQAVREAASLPAEEALAKNVIDLIAANSTELLQKLDGRKLNVLGQDITLETKFAILEHRAPDWRGELLSIITNPNIAYILMLVGIYGLLLEFYSPGAIVPGTIGGICLLLAMFAFQLLPINYAGMALIILGIALMIAETFAPGVGILGFGGVIAFVIGSIILMDTEAPGFGINLGLVAGVALSSAAFFILALGMLLKSRQAPVVSGKEEMIGKTGTALEDFTHTGMIRVHSEIWQAQTDQVLHKNQQAQVTGLNGLRLLVKPITNKEEL